MDQKLAPELFFVLVRNPKQQLHAKNYFKNKIHWKGIIKTLQKIKLYFFLSNPVPFNGQSYQKQKGPGIVNSCSSGYEISSQKLIYDILSDQVWWCNMKRSLSYSKYYTCKFMQANSLHHKLLHFHLFFWIWKVW